MSDSTRFTPAGTGELPPAAALDPSAEGSLPELPPSSTIVLLLAATDDLPWAADAAVALSTAWARNGRRVVLADLHLENPSLHERVGAANLEGMVDIFLYGASIARSARPVRGRGFYLISAGTYEPDAEAIYHHPRWPKLMAGFRDASATLLLFAPADSVDLEALSRWIDGVVLLGRPREGDSLAPARKAGVPVHALLVPPGEPVPDPQPDPVEPRESPASHRYEEDRELLLPPPPERPEPRRRTRKWLLALVLLIAVGALAGVGYLMASNGSLRLGRISAGSAAADRAPVAAPAPPPAPTRAGEALPFSVQVKAFSSFPAAREEMGSQQQRFADVPFFVSPEEVQGVLYFKIMAGLAADTAVANRLQAQLIEAGAIDEEDAAGAWSLIRPTPFAFDLGEFSSAEGAGARADSLLQSEIPTYVVPMPYSDGSRRWQLYGGAYQDSTSADAMRRRLASTGLQSRLVLRLGETAGGGAPVP